MKNDPTIKNWCQIKPLTRGHHDGAMASYTQKTPGDTVMMIGGETLTTEILEPQYWNKWVETKFSRIPIDKYATSFKDFSAITVERNGIIGGTDTIKAIIYVFGGIYRKTNNVPNYNSLVHNYTYYSMLR